MTKMKLIEIGIAIVLTLGLMVACDDIFNDDYVWDNWITAMFRNE